MDADPPPVIMDTDPPPPYPGLPEPGPSAPGPSAPGPSAPGPSSPGPPAPGPSSPGPPAQGPPTPRRRARLLQMPRWEPREGDYLLAGVARAAQPPEIVPDPAPEDVQMEDVFPVFEPPPKRPKFLKMGLQKVVFIHNLPVNMDPFWDDAKLLNCNYSLFSSFSLDTNKTTKEEERQEPEPELEGEVDPDKDKREIKVMGRFKTSHQARSVVADLIHRYGNTSICIHLAKTLAVSYWRAERSYIAYKQKEDMQSRQFPYYTPLFDPTVHHTVLELSVYPALPFKQRTKDQEELFKNLNLYGDILQKDFSGVQGNVMAWIITYKYSYQAAIAFAMYDNYRKDGFVYLVNIQHINIYERMTHMLAYSGSQSVDSNRENEEECFQIKDQFIRAYEMLCCRIHCKRFTVRSPLAICRFHCCRPEVPARNRRRQREDSPPPFEEEQGEGVEGEEEVEEEEEEEAA